MFQWITDIWTKVQEIVNATGSTLDDLCTRLDNVQFTDDFAITRFLALIHYIAGTPMYLMLTSLTIIGCGFVLWKLIKIVINSIANLIPGLKGRISVQ